MPVTMSPYRLSELPCKEWHKELDNTRILSQGILEECNSQHAICLVKDTITQEGGTATRDKTSFIGSLDTSQSFQNTFQELINRPFSARTSRHPLADIFVSFADHMIHWLNRDKCNFCCPKVAKITMLLQAKIDGITKTFST